MTEDSGATAQSPAPRLTVGALLAQLDVSTLVRDLSPWVFVGPPPIEESDEWNYRTQSARTVRSSSGGPSIVLDDGFLVLPLKKSRPGPFATTVLVGRSRTNDLCLIHSSVSKLHARIRLTSGAPALSDAGSSNGTFVGETMLQNGMEKMLNHADSVRFGGCAFQVLETTRFAELLSKLAKRP